MSSVPAKRGLIPWRRQLGGRIGLRRHRLSDREFHERLYALLTSRRSIREFRDQPVPREILERVLFAGIHAASGKNSQNWRFLVLEGEKKDAYLKLTQKAWDLQKDSLQGRLKPSLYAFTKRFFYTLGNAPVVVLCYSCPDDDVCPESNIGSVFLAIQNIVVACGAEGLGTCSMGAPLKIADDVNRFVDIARFEAEEGRRYHLVSSLVLGWPAHQPPEAPRKLENRIRFLDGG